MDMSNKATHAGYRETGKPGPDRSSEKGMTLAPRFA